MYTSPDDVVISLPLGPFSLAAIMSPSNAGAITSVMIIRMMRNSVMIGFRVGSAGGLCYSFGKQSHACCIPMEKIPATDRTDFTLCKKAPNGNRPQPIRDRFRIVVQPAEQALPSTTAAEDQCAQGGIVVHGAICRQQQVQILAGRLGVSQVKLDR